MADNMPQSMDLIHPNGQIYTVPQESVDQALQSGYKVPTQEQLQDAAEQAKYGEHPGIAAATGAIKSMLPFGIGVKALTSLGVNPEDIQKVEQYNPGASLTGEVGGLFAPSPIGLGKIASEVGGAVKGSLKSEEAASKILSRVAPETTGSAVEGALFGGSNVVNEAVLGDPNLTAESALNEIGASAMWGAGIGAGLGIAGHAIPEAVTKAKEKSAALSDSFGLSNLTDKLKEGYATLSSVASGVPKEDILAAIANRGTEAAPLESAEISRNLQSHFDSIEQAKKTALKDIRPEEIERLVTNVPQEAATNEASKIYSAVDSAVQTMRSEPELYPPTYARQLELIRDSLPKKITSESTPAEVFKGLNDLKQLVDTKIPYEKVPSAASQNAIGIIKDLRGQIKDSLENEEVWGQAGVRQAKFNEALSDYLKSANSARQSGDFAKNFMIKSGGSLKVDPVKVEAFLKAAQTTRGLKGAAALSGYIESSNRLLNEIEESYKALPDKEFDKDSIKSLIDRNAEVIENNRQQAILNRMSKGAEAGGSGAEPLVAGAIGHALGLPHAAVGAIFGAAEALRYPGQTIQRLAKLEEALNNTQKKIIKAAKVLAGPTEKATSYLKGYVASQIPFGKKEYDKKVEEIEELSSNPAKLMDTFSKNTSNLELHAPNTARSFQETGSRALGFLASKIPQKPSQGPLAPKIEPSAAERATFSRYYQAVEEPLSVLKEAAAGTLTHQGVEVLRTVYPALYNSISRALSNELMNTKESLPYQRRLMLSLLLTTDVDGTTKPQNIASNQQLLNISAMQQQAKDAAFAGGGKARAKGLDNLSVSNRALTAQQQTAQRSEG